MSEKENKNVENSENIPLNPEEQNIENTILDASEENENNVENETTSEPEATEAKTDSLLDEINSIKDKYIRLQAEFDNYKKRNIKERLELMQTANKETIVSLLDVLDDAERAEQQMQNSDDLEAIKQGVLLVFNKLRKTLENKGVKAMESKGTDFDVELHEAITEIPMEGQQGKVIDEVQKGYYLNEKLIRFAKVVVGS